jgi:hypothetical protein
VARHCPHRLTSIHAGLDELKKDLEVDKRGCERRIGRPFGEHQVASQSAKPRVQLEVSVCEVEADSAFRRFSLRRRCDCQLTCSLSYAR